MYISYSHTSTSGIFMAGLAIQFTCRLVVASSQARHATWTWSVLNLGSTVNSAYSLVRYQSTHL